MKLSTLAVAMLTLMAPASAQAAAFVASFNGVCTTNGSATTAKCSNGENGTYGLATTLTSTNDSTLKVLLSGWQAKQDTGVVSSAFLGAYGGGFGVTGINDASGANNLHTFDNIGGYTDFVLLQFSRAVQLTSVKTNAYALNVNGGSVTDSDLSYFNANGVVNPSAWNVRADLTSSVSNLYNVPGLWTNVSSSSASPRPLNVPADQFSTVWLISSSMLTNDQNDGFKLSLINVTPQVPPIPEPATWAMMIAGFGVIGASLRRRRRALGVPQAA